MASSFIAENKSTAHLFDAESIDNYYYVPPGVEPTTSANSNAAISSSTAAHTRHSHSRNHSHSHGHDHSQKDEFEVVTDLDDSDSPYLEVRIAVSNTDDPTALSLTFRVWLLGLIFSVLLSAANQLMMFRDAPVVMSLTFIQILAYPCGKLLEFILPRTQFKTFGWMWSFNPGQFTIKEHTLLVVLVSSSTSSLYAMEYVIMRRAFYKDPVNFWTGLLMVATAQMVGYGFAGLCRRLLIFPASMIWPAILANVVLLRSFHERTNWPGLSRTKMFWTVLIGAFVWYWVPGYAFSVLSNIAILCLFNRRSKLMFQLSDGMHGLGIAGITLDWSSIVANLPNPIATPFWAVVNVFIGGAVLSVWTLTPAIYYTNTFSSQDYPIYRSGTYTVDGKAYNISRIMTPDLMLNATAYDQYSPLRMSAGLAVYYAVGFATLTSLISYTLLHYRVEILARLFDALNQPEDIHMRLMKSYKEVPNWWYASLLLFFVAVGIILCEVLHVGLRFWWFLLALAMALVFLIPIGMILAITNIAPGLNIFTELIYGYIDPGNPLGNAAYKVWGYTSLWMAHALVGDLKLGHYMKIPPRHLFIAQVVGTLIAVFTQMGISYWAFAHIPNLCDTSVPGNRWSCRMPGLFYQASIIYGVVAPKRTFNDQDYNVLLHAFWIGLLLPVPIYFIQKRYPTSWISNIHVPLILSAFLNGPAMMSVSFTSFMLVALLFNQIRKHRLRWYGRYAYAVAAGLDAGTSLASILVGLLIAQIGEKFVPKWSLNDPICIQPKQ
ncbi:OPT family small oligopeptide transporter [Ramicandelaber brevisporus]|nr:OPT family small oligopeptide transporter [Ramicandelaber brevisporus]